MAKNNRAGIIIAILSIVIVLLLLVILYIFVVQPRFTGYVVDRQTEGFQYAILSIMQQAATCQPVPLTAGNQTINIVAMECFQQQAQQPQQTIENPEVQTEETNQ